MLVNYIPEGSFMIVSFFVLLFFACLSILATYGQHIYIYVRAANPGGQELCIETHAVLAPDTVCPCSSYSCFVWLSKIPPTACGCYLSYTFWWKRPRAPFRETSSPMHWKRYPNIYAQNRDSKHMALPASLTPTQVAGKPCLRNVGVKHPCGEIEPCSAPLGAPN